MENPNLGRLDEVAPKGWSGTVKAMKDKHPEIDNPYALSWWMKRKGDEAHYKPMKDDSSLSKGKPEKKKKYKDEEKKSHKSFKEWYALRESMADGPMQRDPEPSNFDPVQDAVDKLKVLLRGASPEVIEMTLADKNRLMNKFMLNPRQADEVAAMLQDEFQGGMGENLPDVH